jgi:hypothetical protein
MTVRATNFFAGLALVQMVGQRQRHAMAQRRFGKIVLRVQQDASVAAIAELPGIELAKSLDQIGLAMEIDRVLVGGGFHLVNPDRAAAFGLWREITRLTPFQGFLKRADAVRRPCGVEDQPPQRQQLCPDRLRIGAENRINRGI